MYKIWKTLDLLKTFDTVEKTWLAKSTKLSGIQRFNYVMSDFLRCCRDLIWSIELKIGCLESEKIRSLESEIRSILAA